MKSAKIEGGVVTNVIIGSLPGFAVCSDEVQIGWPYDCETFAAPEPELTSEPEPIDPRTLPLDRVRFEFMRDKLDRDNPGFITSVEAMFNALPEDTTAEADFKLLAKVLWRTGDQFYIHHGLFTLAVYEEMITQQAFETAWVEALAVTW